MGEAIAVGMFDGVHLGHQSLVHQVNTHAHERGLHTRIITFQTHPMQLICPERAPRLLTTEHQRLQLLLQAGAEQSTALDFNADLRRLTAEEFMALMREKYDVKLWVIGFNHRFGSDGIRDINEYARIGAKLGIEVIQATEEVVTGMEVPVSSSLIRQDLADGRLERANLMLGRPYSIIGKVEAGRQIGRTIGFPTANVKPVLDCQLVPRSGAYACRAVIEGDERQWLAMTNIGCRPTIADGLSQSIEAHIIDFDGDLYGKTIEVQFLRRLRDECCFPDLAALQRQLQQDLQAAREQ